MITNASNVKRGDQTGATPVVLLAAGDSARYAVQFVWLKASTGELCELQIGGDTVLETDATMLRETGGPFVREPGEILQVTGTGTGTHQYAVTLTRLNGGG